MEKKWSDSLTEDQQKIMTVLSGYIADMTTLFELLTKDMPEKHGLLCKMGYIESIMLAIGITKDIDMGFWDKEGNYKEDVQKVNLAEELL